MLKHRFFEGGGLPASFESGVYSAAFKTDFRAWLKYEYLGNCADLTPQEKIEAFRIVCLEDPETAVPDGFLIDALAWFHSCADVERLALVKLPQRTPAGTEAKTSLYWDFYYIWASFRQQYDLDLYEREYLHWWEFRRLLASLKPDTPYSELRALRGMTKDVYLQKKNKLAESDWSLVEYEQIIKGLPE